MKKYSKMVYKTVSLYFFYFGNFSLILFKKYALPLKLLEL